MIGTTVCVLTSAALIVLFALSVRYQFYTLEEFRRRPRWLGLLCQYRLFSPVPLRADVHLVARDFGRDGLPRPCREIPVHRLRRWSDVLWNPWKRRSLPLVSLMRLVTQNATALEEDRVAVQICLPYLVLLDMVSAEPAADDVVARQFLLVERFGHEPELATTVLFCSAVHRLEGGERATAARSEG